MSRPVPGRGWRADRARRWPSWLHGGSRMAGLVAAHDWHATPLGDPEHWPAALRHTVNLVLTSGISTLFVWGEAHHTFYNDAYAPILDGKPEALGRPMAEVFPEVWDRVGPLIATASAGETVYLEDFATDLWRDGRLQTCTWNFSYSPIVDEAGAVHGVLCTVIETTARLRAERALRESEAKLRAFSDLVPDFLWRQHRDGRMTWLNMPARAALGIDETGPIAAMPWLHPDDREPLRREWRRASAARAPLEHAHRVQIAHGGYRWVLSRAQPELDEDGAVREWCGCTTDIHDLHEALDAVAQGEALFRSFAANSTALLWVADAASGRIEYLSPAFAAIWGMADRDRIDWRRRLDSIHPDDRASQEPVLDRLVAGETLHEAYRIVRPDGSVRWIDDTMFPIRGEDGTIRRVGGIARDVTPENRTLIHLVGRDTPARRALAAHLAAAGYQVRPIASVDGFVRYAPLLLPGCVVHLEDGNGPEVERLAGALRGQADRLPLILVSAIADVARAVAVMRAGVRDIVSPAEPRARLDGAIAAALATLGGSDRPDHDPRAVARAKLAALSERERQILDRLAAGATSKMIGRDLAISPRTVETYRTRIVERIGARNLAEAIQTRAVAGL